MMTQLLYPLIALFLPESVIATAGSEPASAPRQVQLATAEAPALVTPAPIAPRVSKKEKPTAAVLPEPSELPGAIHPAAADSSPLHRIVPLTAILGDSTLVAAAPSATDVVKKVQAFYNNAASFKATFQQTVTNQTFNKLKPKKEVGKVYIMKPGMMRWDYVKKSKTTKSFISNGKHLWAVMHLNKEFYKSDLQESALPVAVSFLMGTGDLLKDFDAKLDTPGKFGSKSDLLLLLTPKTPSARYKKLWLVVDKSSFAVKQSVVLNTKGDTNEIRFDNAKINDASLRKGHFIFNERANPTFRKITPPQPKSGGTTP